MKRNRWFTLLLALGASTLYGGLASAGTQNAKILAINDFHGQISEGLLVSNRPVGSAPVLAAYLEDAMAGMEDRTLIVHAGDFVGASPVASGLLQDEPAIMFYNMLGNDSCGYGYRREQNPRCNLLGVLGNHEFDEGVGELNRLLNGGNHADGPFLQDPWLGAAYPTLCANVVKKKGGRPLVQPFVIKKVGGTRIGFIGAVLPETPTMVKPSGVAGLSFLDPATSVNYYANILKGMGVRAIVAVIHEGGTQSGDVISGPIADIVEKLDSEVDLVLSGHSHTMLNGYVENKKGKEILVTQAYSKGTAYADIDLKIDRGTRDIVEKSATIVTTWADEGPGLSPDPEVEALVAAAEEKVDPIIKQRVGKAANDILKAQNDAGESALGNLIADAQRANMETDFAFMNPGGIRADIAAGKVTWGDLYNVQPFNNYLVKMYLTGSQIHELLEQQWVDQPYARVLQISGIQYTWDNSQDPGSRIVSVAKADGTPILMDDTLYSITVNSFLADGGDNFTVLKEGTERKVGMVDLEALVDYVKALDQPFTANIEGRISRLN